MKDFTSLLSTNLYLALVDNKMKYDIFIGSKKRHEIWRILPVLPRNFN